MRRKSVTIDDLAGMVQHGFEDLRGDFTKKFGKVEDRLGKFEERMGKVEETMEGMGRTLKSLDQHFVAHISLSEREHADFHETLTDHDSRINMLKDKVVGVA